MRASLAMRQLEFFFFLIFQSSLAGLGLAALLATAMVFALHDRAETARLLLLPVFWIVPPILGGIFVDPARGAKTADWLGYVALAMPVAYLFAAVWCFATLPRRSGLVAGVAVLNAPFVLMGALVMKMASGGTWL